MRLGSVKVINSGVEVAVIKLPGLRVFKISADFINLMLLFFEAAVKNTKKCQNLLVFLFLVGYSALVWFSDAALEITFV